MSILNEYLNKRLGFLDLKAELQRLIGLYNRHTKRTLFVYAADLTKTRISNSLDISMNQEDFYVIQDILRESTQTSIDFYIETPGGSGEAAEEIARFLRKKFVDGVNFVIAGEAKSAGTILALSGDNIFMTDTGSLGPIDAQVKIGRFVVSAHDYKEWVEEKKKEAADNGRLNPFDAIMVAQISPGEISGVLNSLAFAKDLVREWLCKYKFKNWTETRSSKQIVTMEMRQQRADEVAEQLCNHTEWRTHGRSLKIEDLSEKLIIERIDDDLVLADIVYRIKTVIRLFFDQSPNYKMFFMEDFELAKGYNIASPGTNPAPIIQGDGPPGLVPGKKQQPQQKVIEGVDMDIACPKCSKRHKIKGFIDIRSDEIIKNGLKPSPLIKENDILECDACDYAIDLKPIKNNFESQTKRKLIFK